MAPLGRVMGGGLTLIRPFVCPKVIGTTLSLLCLLKYAVACDVPLHALDIPKFGVAAKAEPEDEYVLLLISNFNWLSLLLPSGPH